MHKSLDEMIEKADALYSKRSEIANICLSVELLKDFGASSYDAAWRMGRAHFFLGQESNTKSEIQGHHDQGIEASASAVTLNPSGVEGHFWLGVNLALMAQSKIGYNALILVWRAMRSLRHAVRIDPSYHGAGPLRVLARIQHKLPWIFGGSRKQARGNFEKAIRLAPANTVTRIYFAEFLSESGETESARKQLETIDGTIPDPDWDFETKRDMKLAKLKLARMTSGDSS